MKKLIMILGVLTSGTIAKAAVFMSPFPVLWVFLGISGGALVLQNEAQREATSVESPQGIYAPYHSKELKHIIQWPSTYGVEGEKVSGVFKPTYGKVLGLVDFLVEECGPEVPLEQYPQLYKILSSGDDMLDLSVADYPYERLKELSLSEIFGLKKEAKVFNRRAAQTALIMANYAYNENPKTFDFCSSR